MKNEELRTKSGELDFVVVVEQFAEVEQGIEEFFEGGGAGNAYEQPIVAFGLYGNVLAYFDIGTGTDMRIGA